MRNGYIKLHRAFLDWYGISSPQRVTLWIHLLLLANHAPNKWLFKGEVIQIERGQLITSRKSLSTLTSLSESCIERLLKELQKQGQIEQLTSNRSRLITIVRYDDYQKADSGKDNSEDNKRTTDEHPPDTIKKNKKEKNERSIDILDFEKLWKQYPSNDGKKAALRHFQASVKTEEEVLNINKALKNYLSCKKVKDGFIKNGSTWFNNWRDWIDYLEPKTETQVKKEYETKARNEQDEIQKQWEEEFNNQ